MGGEQMKSLIQILAVAALGVTTLVACPQPGPNPNAPKINSFLGKAANSQNPNAATVSLPAGGGQVELSWDVTGADALSIDQSVPAISGATGKVTVNVTATKTFTLTASKNGSSSTASVAVNVAAGITVNGTVKSFDGTPAIGVTIQIGDASADNRVQTQTDGDGKFTAPGVTPPYTITAIPASLADELPVSFKGVNRADPTVVLEPQTGKTKPCNKAEAYVRFRLNGGSKVADNSVGYMYYLADGIHEDSLLSNAVTVMNPGERGGYVRVVFSNATCKTQVTGSLVYLERGQNGYTFAGKLDNVDAITGTATPSGDNPYLVTIAGTGSVAVSGQITLPVGYDKGFVYPILKVGKASVIVSDPRDISIVNKLSQTGNQYGFNLPPAINGVTYRIGAFVEGPAHFAWFASEPLAVPLPVGGLTRDITTSNTYQAQEPAGNIIDNVTPVFAWTATNPANLYYINYENINCNQASWTAVSTGATSTELTRFQLPRLPQPARLDVGTISVPCRYSWSPNNAISVREADITADKMLDGRLVLKRYYSKKTGFPTFQAIVPVNLGVADVSNPTAAIPSPATTIYRPEYIAGQVGVVAPIDPTKTTSTDVKEPGANISGLLIPSADRAEITEYFSTEIVGPFNNPDEIGSGVLASKFQEFQTQK
jgi:hypothetical protein